MFTFYGLFYGSQKIVKMMKNWFHALKKPREKSDFEHTFVDDFCPQ